MKKKRIYMGIVGIFILILLSIFTIKLYEDRQYSRMFQKDDLIINAPSNTVTVENASVWTMITSGPIISLPRGIYEVTIYYNATAEGNCFEFWDGDPTQPDKINIQLLSGDFSLPMGEKQDTVKVEFLSDISNLEIITYFGGQGECTIEGVRITCLEGHANANDYFLIPLIICAICIGWCLIYWKSSKEFRKHQIIISIAIICVSIPCFVDYLVAGSDIRFEANRIVSIASALEIGELPVRIHPSAYNGYGQAVSIFYPDILLYVPAAFYILGMSLTACVHFFWFFMSTMTAIIMYFCVSRMLRSNRIACIASILYVLSFCRIGWQYYYYGFGSSTAMIFLPLIIYGFYEIMFGDKKRWLYLTLGITGVLQTHILSFLLSVLFLGGITILCLFKVRDVKRYLSFGEAACVTCLLNAWFLTPFLRMYFAGIDTDSLLWTVPSRDQVELSDVFTLYGGLGIPRAFELSLLIGCLLFVIVYVREKEKRKLLLVLLIIGIFAVFASTKYYPWEFFEEMKYIGRYISMIQRAPRLMCFATPCLVIVAAYGYANISKKVNYIPSVGIAIALITSIFFMRDYLSRDVACMRGEIVSSFSGATEYLYPNTEVRGLIEGRYVASEGVHVEAFEKEGTNAGFCVTSDIGGYVDLPLFYYPGYEAYCNGKELELTFGENNEIRVLIPAGSEGEIKCYYEDFSSWKVANIITVLTCLGIIIVNRMKRGYVLNRNEAIRVVKDGKEKELY